MEKNEIWQKEYNLATETLLTLKATQIKLKEIFNNWEKQLQILDTNSKTKEVVTFEDRIKNSENKSLIFFTRKSIRTNSIIEYEFQPRSLSESIKELRRGLDGIWTFNEEQIRVEDDNDKFELNIPIKRKLFSNDINYNKMEEQNDEEEEINMRESIAPNKRRYFNTENKFMREITREEKKHKSHEIKSNLEEWEIFKYQQGNEAKNNFLQSKVEWYDINDKYRESISKQIRIQENLVKEIKEKKYQIQNFINSLIKEKFLQIKYLKEKLEFYSQNQSFFNSRIGKTMDKLINKTINIFSKENKSIAELNTFLRRNTIKQLNNQTTLIFLINKYNDILNHFSLLNIIILARLDLLSNNFSIIESEKNSSPDKSINLNWIEEQTICLDSNMDEFFSMLNTFDKTYDDLFNKLNFSTFFIT